MGNTQSTHTIRKKNSNINMHYEALINQNTYNFDNILPSNNPNMLNIPINNDVLDLMSAQHFLYRHIWKSNFSSPIDKLLKEHNGCRVLDVGCGGGSWLLEMATDYPQVQFVGMDVAPVYPQEIMPNNVQFISADVLKPLPFFMQFDFVRLSLLGTSLTQTQWPVAIENISRVLKPDAYFEIVEHDFVPIKMGPIYRVFVTELVNLFKSCDINPQIVYQINTMLLQSGQFTEIEYSAKPLPIGKYGGQVGIQSVSNLSIWFESIIKQRLYQHMGIDEEEYDCMWKACKDELNSGEIYYNTYRFWGRKL